ncbi:MAG TPA: preprotein translocase subunit SecG [Aquifex aeolicus]|nr:preprotein translocase subunit SecG [Aquifex aeolicus]
MYYALLTLFVIISVILIIATLLQKGRGDVGAAFGSAMGQSIFGVGGVETVLTKATYWLGALFLILALLLSIIPKDKSSVVEKLQETPETQQSEGKGNPSKNEK